MGFPLELKKQLAGYFRFDFNAFWCFKCFFYHAAEWFWGLSCGGVKIQAFMTLRNFSGLICVQIAGFIWEFICAYADFSSCFVHTSSLLLHVGVVGCLRFDPPSTIVFPFPRDDTSLLLNKKKSVSSDAGLSKPRGKDVGIRHRKERAMRRRRSRVIHVPKSDSRLANNALPVDIQRLRCRAMYYALRFSNPIESLGKVLRLHANECTKQDSPSQGNTDGSNKPIGREIHGRFAKLQLDLGFVDRGRSGSEQRMRWLTGGGVVVLFPFMARGHINPFLDLAHLLSARYPSLCLTLLTTSGNLPLFRRLPHPPSLRFAVLPFCPSDHGLPPDADSTFALPPHLVSRIYHAAEASLPPSFRALLMDLLDDEDEASPPLLCLIADMFLAWTVPIAEELGVFQATLYTSGPFAMSMYNSIWINLPHADGREGDDDEIAVPGLPGVTVRRRQLSPNMRSVTSTDHPASQFVRRQAEFCHRSRATLWNTAEIIEKPYLEQWARSMNQPVYAVGPLFAAASVGARRAATDDYGGLAAECLAWLDERAPKSVVYVSFGSQNRMPPEEMVELLAALEKQSRPFLWAAPAADQAPPPEATTAGGGLVARGWVPQAEILAHEAVGAFMSHGGWNSVLESLRFGVPVVIRPLGAEQFCNAKLVVEVLGAGAEASVGAKALEAVAEVMGDGERGKEVRRRASEIAAGLAAAVAEANAGGADGVGPSLCRIGQARLADDGELSTGV
ncbi:hypothetical protein ZIOFF_062856 [Zingiber officinale]|uniref:UDP-glycosyltransferases domain-containing protein n=1 Tax=Zingiber officinale TaxID=94328 RepID=A0A8J5F601_ZINOF|nr:hypothetical protein ZIOFF_062856 [Zingiber officinale]